MVYVAWVQDFSLLHDRYIDYNMPTEIIGEYKTVEDGTSAIKRYIVVEKRRFHRVWELCKLDIDYAMNHYSELETIPDFKKRFEETQDPDEEFLDDLVKLENFCNFQGKCHTNVCEKKNISDFEGPIVWNTDWE